MPENEIKEFKDMAPSNRLKCLKNLGCFKKNKKRLLGFTSTTRKYDVALGFALKAEDKIAVVFEMYIQNTHQNNYFLMGPEYSAYPDEEEILLFDGLEFCVFGYDDRLNQEGRRVVTIKLYNDSRHPKKYKNLQKLNYDLVKQELNN